MSSLPQRAKTRPGPFWPRRGPPRPLHKEAGWTLVDLMVGMAVGLFLCAVAGTLMLSQWREHRHLLAETLLQQELRNAIALLRHEVHRSGADPTAHELVPEHGRSRWHPAEAPRLQLLLESAPIPDDHAGDGLSLAYVRSEAGEARRRIERGFRLQGTQLQYLLERSWQPWSDSNTVRFIRMEVRLERSEAGLPEPCSRSRTCPDTDADADISADTGAETDTDSGTYASPVLRSCEARLQAQTLHVLLVGQSRLDPRTVRSINSSIHVRNQRLEWPASPC